MSLVCRTCGQEKPVNKFHLNSASSLGVFKTCAACRNAKGRSYGKAHARERGAYINRYRRTYFGRIMALYNQMSRRVRGVDKVNYARYIGLPILPKRTFYTLAVSSATYKRLFMAWKAAGFPLKLVPSVNRVDSSRGYEKDNIEFVTQSQNSRDGALSRWRAAS